MAKRKKKIVRGSNRYRAVQHILSTHTKANGIKLGRGFNKAAGELYRKTKDSPLKYVQQNIEQLWKEFGAAPIHIPIDFPNDFPFYYFLDKLDQPMFDEVMVGISFKDEELDIITEGKRDEISEFYKDNLHQHLRKFYNESPVAIFKIIDTDQKTFINYEIITGIDLTEAPPEDIIPETEKVGENPQTPAIIPSGESEIDKQIKLKELEIKASEAKIRENESRIKLAQEFKDLMAIGLTKDEAKALLGL